MLKEQDEQLITNVENSQQPAVIEPTLGGVAKNRGSQARTNTKYNSREISTKYITEAGLKIGDTVNYVSKSMREQENYQPKQAVILAMPGDKFKFSETKIIDVLDNEIIIIDPVSADKWKPMRISSDQTSQPATPEPSQVTETLSNIYFNHIVIQEQTFTNTPVKVSIISQGRIVGPDGQQKDQWVYTVGPKAGQEVSLQQDQDDFSPNDRKSTNNEEQPVPEEFKASLLNPSNKFDPEKRYYLNIAGKNMSRQFQWKELKNKNLQVTFASKRNILNAQQNLQTYAKSLITESVYDDLYSPIFQQLFEQIIHDVQDINLGKLGTISKNSIVNVVINKMVGAGTDWKRGLGPDDIAGEVAFTDAAYKTAKQQANKLIEEFFKLQPNNIIIPGVGFVVKTSAGTFEIRSFEDSISSVSIDSTARDRIITFVKTYIIEQINQTETRTQLTQVIPSTLNQLIAQLKTIPAITTFISQVTGLPRNQSIKNASQTITTIIDTMARRTGILKIDLEAIENIHNVVFSLFCEKPEQYLLYLDEDQWNDIILGGKVIGTMAGLISGIAKAF